MPVTHLWYLALFPLARSLTIDFERDSGAVAHDSSLDVAIKNGEALNSTLASLQVGDVLVVPNKTFTVMGGIHAEGLHSVTIQIDGTLEFSDNIKHWPRKNEKGDVAECITLKDITNVTLTSSGKGTLDGKGDKWWGIPGIGYLVRVENRPRLVMIENGTNILVENLLFKNSPYWTFTAWVDGLEVRNNLDFRFIAHPTHSTCVIANESLTANYLVNQPSLSPQTQAICSAT